LTAWPAEAFTRIPIRSPGPDQYHRSSTVGRTCSRAPRGLAWGVRFVISPSSRSSPQT